MADEASENGPLTSKERTLLPCPFCGANPQLCEPQIAMIRASLDFAAKAMARGDIVAMIQAYNDLKEYEA